MSSPKRHVLNDHEGRNALIFYRILSTDSVKKCTEISEENSYADIET